MEIEPNQSEDVIFEAPKTLEEYIARYEGHAKINILLKLARFNP